MKKDNWIYTFNFKDTHCMSQLWSLVKDDPQFNEWASKSGLLTYIKKQPELILNALVHTSFVHEQPQLNLSSNERLEFLGDAYLDAEVSQILWDKYPQLKEGQLSKFRSSLVNEEVLAFWGRSLGLAPFIFLGKGESERLEVESAIVADAFEALIGAIALIDRSSLNDLLKLWITIFNKESELNYLDEKRLELFDPKTQLQEYTLELYKEVPHYESVEDEEVGFECSLSVLGHKLGSAKGKSKKRAEMAAAKKVLIKENYKNITNHQES